MMKIIEELNAKSFSSKASTAEHTIDESLSDSSSSKIWSWNVNGLRPILIGDEFDNFMRSAKPDVLCLNETKITDETLVKDELREIITKWFPIDLQFWNCGKANKDGKNKAYHGTAVFVSKNFKGGRPLFFETDIGKVGEHDKEGRTITCHFKDFILVCSYWPCSGRFTYNKEKEKCAWG